MSRQYEEHAEHAPQYNLGMVNTLRTSSRNSSQTHTDKTMFGVLNVIAHTVGSMEVLGYEYTQLYWVISLLV
jgi:hypothetical protein